MTGYHVNELATRGGVPREAVAGELGDGATIETVALSLTEAGVAGGRLFFLVGDAGIAALRSGGSALSRLMEGTVRERTIASLESGETLIVVTGVDRDDLPDVEQAMDVAGVGRRVYFGRWTHNAAD